jgi:hypothetical protein
VLYRRLECKTIEIGGGVVIFEMQLEERALIKCVAPAELVALADGVRKSRQGRQRYEGPAARGYGPLLLGWLPAFGWVVFFDGGGCVRCAWA